MDASGHFVFGPLEGSGCCKLDESLLLIFCSLLKQVSILSQSLAVFSSRKQSSFSGEIHFVLVYTHLLLSPPDPLLLLSSLVFCFSLSPPFHLICSSPIISASFFFSSFSHSFCLSVGWHLHYFNCFPHLRPKAQSSIV